MKLLMRVLQIVAIIFLGIVAWQVVLFTPSPPRPLVFRASAKRMTAELASSIDGCHADYTKFPVTTDSSADWGGNTVANPEFLAVLSAKGDRSLNPKRHDYLDGFKQAKILSDGKAVNGIDYSDPATPKLYDPWGQPYHVIMDTNEDGKITLPFVVGSSADVSGKRSVVYSTGEPNANGTPNSDPAKFIKSF